MLGAVWLCVLALALPCWTYPSGHITTCEEFGRGVNFDPVNAIGEWFAVYSILGIQGNRTDTFTIRKLTHRQLLLYRELIKDYSNDKLKLMMRIHESRPLIADMQNVLVPLDYAGNVDAWIAYSYIQVDGKNMTMNNEGQFSLKWKSVEGFLVLMHCFRKDVYVLSKTTTPDEDKLQRVVENLHILGFTGGGRIYPSL